MLNLSVMITVKMRGKMFMTMGTQNVFWFRVCSGYAECFLIPSKIIIKKFPLVAKWTVYEKSCCIKRFLSKEFFKNFWVNMFYFLLLIVLTFWSFHWSVYKMLLILLRNSAFFPVKIFILFPWFCDIILLSKRFFRKKRIWVCKIHFKKLASDIYPTRFTPHQTSWQPGK